MTVSDAAVQCYGRYEASVWCAVLCVVWYVVFCVVYPARDVGGSDVGCDAMMRHIACEAVIVTVWLLLSGFLL